MGRIRYIYVDEVYWDFPKRNLNWNRTAEGKFVHHDDLSTLTLWQRLEIHRSGVYDYTKNHFILEGCVAKVIQTSPTVKLTIINRPEMPVHMRTFTLYLSKIDSYSFINPSSTAHGAIHYISLSCHNPSIVIIKS